MRPKVDYGICISNQLSQTFGPTMKKHFFDIYAVRFGIWN